MRKATWQNITVEQYQLINAINNQDIDEVDKIIRIISTLFNLTEKEINDLPVTKFHKLTLQVASLFTIIKQLTLNEAPVSVKSFIITNKRMYHISYDVGKQRLGQYIEAQHFLKGGIIENLHLIAASIASPMKFYLIKGRNDSSKHEQVASDFLQAKFIDVYNSVVFFCDVFSKFNKSYSGLFEIDDNEDEELPVHSNGFNERYGWHYSATKIAEHERIKLEEAYDLLVIQSLNDLSYLKAFKQHEAELNKEARKQNEVPQH